jgi:hypothetical protein
VLPDFAYWQWLVLALAAIMALGPHEIAERIERWRRERVERRRREERGAPARTPGVDATERDVWTVVASLATALGLVLWAERL